MNKRKVSFLKIANLILIIIAAILILNMIIPLKPVTGGAIFSYDTDNAACLYTYNEESTEMPVDLCCNEVQKLLSCDTLIDDPNYYQVCYTSNDPSEPHYYLNSDAYNYCILNGFAIQKEA